ncbi:helix-turn-helix domain-containing protein [Pontibacterium sp.]|uniref:helix-turn-helix domain-containing protein n=1 Tax=Pontibacterium sp. TaxID=2036026 RepID=UPI003568004C
MKMPIKTPGEILRTGRLTLKKTQQEVAKEIHKALRTYQKWENNETRPSAFVDIVAVCVACGVPVEDYITGQQPRPYLEQYDIDLLEHYRQLPDKDKLCVLRITEALVKLHQDNMQILSQNAKREEDQVTQDNE